ncbi:MAG: transporter substrate-binding domain-containing protein [Mesorhizobium sp.]|nr:MAG: transporter substrate-binding domain-containing protein [Mesorhizobium sp.]RWO93850.1 MAG: transporter substrate-binding domain-containing protein [Mesorhizobium sp.]RWQ15261.1 MAG: transporter substrate-binding domain-containing protein [Mesorhizobium sp.]TIM34581.1 MAG: transporter substrate-binding domain-containing protein [Mesorhizobium sp.]
MRITPEAFSAFNGQAPDGKLTGFEPDLLAELEKRMGVKCDLFALSLGRHDHGSHRRQES